MKSSFRPLLVLVLFVLGLFRFYYFYSPPPEHEAFTGLEWKLLNGCQKEVRSEVDSYSRSIKSLSSDHNYGLLNCLSEEFLLKSSWLRFNYRVKPSSTQRFSNQGVFVVSLTTGSSQLIAELILDSTSQSQELWESYIFKIPPELVGKKAKISISENWTLRTDEEFYIRDRIDFLTSEPTPLTSFILPGLNKSTGEALVLACMLFLLILVSLKEDLNRLGYFTLVLVASFVLFFSTKPFYYFDEWYVLSRFSEQGFFGVWFPHNEHFLPLFLAWYYFLTSLLGHWYEGVLGLGLVMHAGNSFLLCLVLRSFGLTRKMSQVSALLFALSALHLEVLEWGFEHSILLSAALGLLGLLSSRRFMLSGSWVDLFLSCVIFASAPLFFGNGFIFPPMVFLILLSSFLLPRGEGDLRLGVGKFASRLGLFGFFSAVFLLIPLILYVLNKSTPVDKGSVPSFDSLFGTLVPMFNYILVGSGIGTVIRGLGLYPTLALTNIDEGLLLFYPVAHARMVEILGGSLLLETFFALGGYLILFVFLIFALLFLRADSERRIILFSFLSGLMVLVCAFILPAAVRWNFGSFQALALRYQYVALIGLVFLLVPFFSLVKNVFMSRFYLIRVFSIGGTSILVFVWLFVQSFLVVSFSYFRHHGEQHRIYIQELEEWEGLVGVLGRGVLYEGEGELRGLFPLHRSSISPGSYPVQILRANERLRSN